MATAPAPPTSGAMPPMPSAGAGAPPPNATAPSDASPQLDAGAKAVILASQAMTLLRNMFPQVIPEVDQISDLLQQIQVKMMAGAKAPTEAAPPVNG